VSKTKWVSEIFSINPDCGEEKSIYIFYKLYTPYFFCTVRILTEGRAGEGAHLRSIQASTSAKKWKRSLKEATAFHPDTCQYTKRRAHKSRPFQTLLVLVCTSKGR
jgi:hypothetical protein